MLLLSGWIICKQLVTLAFGTDFPDEVILHGMQAWLGHYIVQVCGLLHSPSRLVVELSVGYDETWP